MPEVVQAVPTAAPGERRPFTREEYERAAEAGLFGSAERLELLGGEIVRKMSPQGTRHATAIRKATEVLRAIFGRHHNVSCQLPLALGADSEPEPDLAVVEGAIDDFATAHPETAVLVIEVAEASLDFDRTVKGSLYARAGIPEYWIVNLQDRVLEVHREPAPMAAQRFGHHYKSITRHLEGEHVAPLRSPLTRIPVRDLMA
jgi:Uma2 family endonuclease